jgi:hypothetical protein
MFRHASVCTVLPYYHVQPASEMPVARARVVTVTVQRLAGPDSRASLFPDVTVRIPHWHFRSSLMERIIAWQSLARSLGRSLSSGAGGLPPAGGPGRQVVPEVLNLNARRRPGPVQDEPSTMGRVTVVVVPMHGHWHGAGSENFSLSAGAAVRPCPSYWHENNLNFPLTEGPSVDSPNRIAWNVGS